MLIEKIFAEATPFLKERKVDECIIGLTIAAVSLDSGEVGTSLVLLEEIESRSDIKFDPEEIRGMSALDMAKWAVDPNEHILKRTLGMAAINACASFQRFPNINDSDPTKSVHLNPNDTVGVIGWMRPLVKNLSEKVNKVIVYDNGEKEQVYAPETQDELLPTCDIVYISGTAVVNGSIDHLLKLCNNAREIILVGPTTPLFPKAYNETKVTVIAGGVWKKECKQEIFSRIALNAGVPSLSTYQEKMAIRIC